MASRRGRHCRPSKISKAAAVASTAAITTVTVAVIAGNATPADASTGGTQVHAPAAHEVTKAVASHQKAAHHSGTVTVAAGDTLAGLAQVHCGAYADWPSLFNANRDKIRDPNLIYLGQVLTLDCSSARVTAAPRKTLRAARHVTGKIWGVTYGYPNLCGDGDGDGWDVNCQARRGGTPARRRVATAIRVAFSSSGIYSFGALENLWVSAGGPAWAERAAATVAECESGGRVDAHNPSGATGLWQILGSVVGGDLYNPLVNAENAVSKFKASGDTWAQWVCKP